MRSLRILCTLFIIIFQSFALQIYAFTSNEYVSLIEKDLFHVQYNKEPLKERLGRIEKEVYGKKYNITTEQRISRLKQVFHYNEPIKTAVKKTTAKNNIKKVNNKIVATKPTATVVLASYPKVTELEKKVFQKSYEKENVYNRLDRLEMAVLKYKTTYSLADRTDNLESSILGGNAVVNTPQVNKASEIIPNSNEKISNLETQILKTTYPNDPSDVRVSRLELSVFNKTSPEDEIQQRIERIEAVANASESNKEFNKAQTTRQTTSKVNAVGLGLLILQGLLF
jgi:hypothetical protein